MNEHTVQLFMLVYFWFILMVKEAKPTEMGHISFWNSEWSRVEKFIKDGLY